MSLHVDPTNLTDNFPRNLTSGGDSAVCCLSGNESLLGANRWLERVILKQAGTDAERRGLSNPT